MVNSAEVQDDEMKTVRDVLEAHGLALPDDALVRTMREAVRAGYGGGAAVHDALAIADDLARGVDGDVQRTFVNTLEYVLRPLVAKAMSDDERTSELTKAEVKLLEQGFGVSARNETCERANEVTELLKCGVGISFMAPFVRTALDLAAMNATAVTVDEAARRTGRGVDQLSEHIRQRSLLAFRGRRIPVFQFAEQAKFVPHLCDVLPELIPNVHPVGVLHWFSEPNPDLICEATDYDPVSPRTWLISDLPVEPVRELAKHVMQES